MKFAGEQRPSHLPGASSNYIQRGWYDILIYLLIFFPVLSLFLNVISWLRFGVDLPYMEDWRSYSSGLMGSFGLKYLFTPSNDTLYPVGLALDSLAQRFLDGNTIVYQFISMTAVLGMLLLLQWHLLITALKDRLLAASAFGLTLLMLQPHSYWGLQNLAYHQAIPLVCILAALSIITGGKWSGWKAPVLFAIGIVSGMSYISGAISVLTTGAVLLIISRFLQHPERRPLTRGGLSLFIAGVLTTLPQLWVIAFVQKGLHRAGTSFAYPFSSDFWFHFLGKVGRSLLLPANHPLPSLVVTVLVLLLCCALLIRYAGRLRKRELKTLSEARTAIVLITLAAMIFVYLLMVSAGRTNRRPLEVDTSLEIFAFAFQRFHFFWVTLLWPWVAAAVFEAARSYEFPLNINPSRSPAMVSALILPPLILTAGALAHAPYYRSIMNARYEGISCIQSAMQRFEPVYCPGVCRRPDISGAVFFAKLTGASFARSLTLPPVPVGTAKPAPLFRLSTAAPGDAVFDNMAAAESSGDRFRFTAGNDPQIIFRTGDTKAMNQCAILEISAIMQTTGTDVAQVFYKVPGQAKFSEKQSEAVPIKNEKEPVEISFLLASPTGFGDSFRFDPVVKPREFDILELEVRCRSSRPRQSLEEDELNGW